MYHLYRHAYRTLDYVPAEIDAHPLERYCTALPPCDTKQKINFKDAKKYWWLRDPPEFNTDVANE